MDHKQIPALLESSLNQLRVLVAERRERPGNHHADDQRISTEIAATLFQIGQARSFLDSQTELLEKQAYQNKTTEARLRQIASQLNDELSISVKLVQPRFPDTIPV